ncbi:MAG: hypothetical protein Q8L63_02900, partial [Alphaproteobacteria bacterium]|nr:hypothetical protein [Alphaproteobacteria bacterium]
VCSLCASKLKSRRHAAPCPTLLAKDGIAIPFADSMAAATSLIRSILSGMTEMESIPSLTGNHSNSGMELLLRHWDDCAVLAYRTIWLYFTSLSERESASVLIRPPFKTSDVAAVRPVAHEPSGTSAPIMGLPRESIISRAFILVTVVGWDLFVVKISESIIIPLFMWAAAQDRFLIPV